jgi:putative ABC transport system substrate-binding protein
MLTTILSTLLVPVGHGASPQTVARVGILAIDERGCANSILRDELRRFGYVEGQNIVYRCRHASGRYPDLPRAARELIATRPDVIVPVTHVVAERALQATRDIPVVSIASGDPTAVGWAASLAHPGKNFTGLTYFSWELYGKRMQLLKTAMPNLKRVGLLVQASASRSLTDLYVRVSKDAATRLGIEPVVIEANNRAEIERAFETLGEDKIEAVHVLGYPLYAEEAQLIADLGILYGIATVHFDNSFPAMGGLMGYGPDYPAMRRRIAGYVDRILRGATPGEMPIEQPTEYKLAINLTTARGLGLAIPQSILVRADKVIE